MRIVSSERTTSSTDLSVYNLMICCHQLPVMHILCFHTNNSMHRRSTFNSKVFTKIGCFNIAACISAWIVRVEMAAIVRFFSWQLHCTLLLSHSFWCTVNIFIMCSFICLFIRQSELLGVAASAHSQMPLLMDQWHWCIGVHDSR